MIRKEDNLALRGIAILFIAIHNLVHLLGYAKENEKSFHIERWDDFFSTFTHPSVDITWNIFSFIGWVGVPVFIFLSGYGLVMKYETGKSPLETKKYLLTNFKKLFWLMLPAVCFFVIWSFCHGDFANGLKKILYLTQMNNLFYPINPFAPGVYWYFGFTFQLYIVYLIYHHYRNKAFLVTTFILSFVILLFFPNSLYGQVALSYLKNNFFGWLPVFLLGIYVGRQSDLLANVFSCVKKRWVWIVFSLLCFIFTIMLNSNYYLWHFLPFMALFMFISFVKKKKKDSIAGNCLLWIGRLSSSIFVVHPIARTLTMGLASSLKFQHISILVCIYLSIVVLLAIYYAKLYKALRLRFVH